MTTAQEGGKVVSLTHRPHLSPGNSPGTHFCQRLSRPQGHSAIRMIMSMKIPMTPSVMNVVLTLKLMYTRDLSKKKNKEQCGEGGKVQGWASFKLLVNVEVSTGMLCRVAG